MNLGSETNHQNIFIHYIRDVTFIVTFGNFWHSQLSILSRDADMLQQTSIWLCGPSDLDPDSIMYYIRIAPCISAGPLNSGLCFTESAASHE